MIVLDTNIVSELMRQKPTTIVLDWASSKPTASLFTTVLTEAEIRVGLARMPMGQRRTRLTSAADQMFAKVFAGRMLPFDSDAAAAYVQLVSERLATGRPIDVFDAQIAAITRSRGAHLATRNVKDFLGCGVEVIDPWSDAARPQTSSTR